MVKKIVIKQSLGTFIVYKSKQILNEGKVDKKKYCEQKLPKNFELAKTKYK